MERILLGGAGGGRGRMPVVVRSAEGEGPQGPARSAQARYAAASTGRPPRHTERARTPLVAHQVLAPSG